MSRAVRPLSDADLLEMLARRDGGEGAEEVAGGMGLTPARVLDALMRIDRDLARSERGEARA